jgi:cellulose synthase/poly-beta-1,6-N-acetylglucosamine synthase-like glycosyltransferase
MSLVDADTILVGIAALLETLRAEMFERSVSNWFLCLIPVVVFFEIPRYYLPLLFLWVAKKLGFPRVDHAARAALLERAPLVSVIVAGRNEGASIQKAIESILSQDYPNFEVIVVDDASDDDMPLIAQHYARRGLIRFVQNKGGRGRGGRPAATNLGVRLARGEFIVSLDADTTFDRSMLRHIIAPFADPRIGVVAGNVLPWNVGRNLLTRAQAIEYALGIDVYKQWSSMLGNTLQASGAIGAFRRDAVVERGGWDQELAEDSDISLRMVQVGWRIAFAAEAVSRTEVPHTLRKLARQRTRWDRGGLRSYFKKHGRLMRPSVAGWAFSIELCLEFLFSVVATFCFPLQLIWLTFTDPFMVPVLLAFSMTIYSVLALGSLAAIPALSGRLRRPSTLIGAALLMGPYKHWLGWVRFVAYLKELFLIETEDSFLPSTAWANARRF